MNLIDLIQNEEDGRLDAFELLDDIVITFAESFFDIDHEEDHIDFLQGILCDFDHEIPKLMLWFMDSRCIDEDHLRFIGRIDSLYFITGRLRLVAHNGDFLADNTVQESRFPDVRSSDDGNKT